MNRKPLSVLLLVLAATPPAWAIAPSGSSAASSATDARWYRPGEVLVKYRARASAPAASALKDAHGFVAKQTLLDGRMDHLVLPSAMDVPGAIAMLSADPAVEYAEPNFLRFPDAVIPNDPQFAQQWGLRNTGQPNFVSGGPAGIPGGDLNMINAWDANNDGTADRTGRGRVVIAIVDDAVQTSHPDLVGNLVPGFDFADNDSNPNPNTSSQSHGTAVAGSAAAVGNNGIGVAGTAWNERIMPLRFGFDTASEVRALEFARNNGATIVNASFGGPTYTRTEFDAVSALNDAGVLLVASAGNQDSNIDISGASYPANYRLPNVIAVAATNRQDGIASFSSYGSVTVPVAAPGLQIVTTTINGGYTTNGISGTSFSAPYVAGIAALIRDYIPTASVSEIRARLIESGSAGVDPNSPVNLRTAGGRVDANTALNLTPRPSIVIRPLQSSRYQLQFSSGTIDVPVYIPVLVEDNGNRALDPGETTNIAVTLENLWLAAANVQARLSASGGGVTVNSGAVTFGNIAPRGAITGRFNVTVPATTTGHQYVNFTLAITADGGYTATRSFILEIGRLSNGQTVTQTIQTGANNSNLYDEFHTWTFDITSLPANGGSLTFATTGSNDIDFFVRYGEPAQYDVELAADPSPPTDTNPAPFYFINVPASQQGAARTNGNESVTIATPRVGTYYVTVVNFDRAPNATYTLRASLDAAAPPANGGSSGGGGALGLWSLTGLFAGALMRRRNRRAKLVRRPLTHG